MGMLSRLTPRAIKSDLHRHGASSTFVRLATSQHVVDLRLIFGVTLLIAVTSIGTVIVISFINIVVTNCCSWDGITGELAKIGPFVGAIGAVACSIVAWIYLTGSARLGVVDLFACEISTLTKVGTIVDVAHTMAAELHPPITTPSRNAMVDAQAIGRFSSAENYFPVFEATTKDLQQLEAQVVRNVTAFYTYTKTMRDYLRRLSDIQVGHEARKATVTNIVYMLYLAYESARKAIDDLIEYEPDRDEAVIVIYLTELQAYSCLLLCFPDSNDIRHRRLMLRMDDYVKAIAKLRTAGVETDTSEAWAPARALVDNLDMLCDAIFSRERFAKALADERNKRVANHACD